MKYIEISATQEKVMFICLGWSATKYLQLLDLIEGSYTESNILCSILHDPSLTGKCINCLALKYRLYKENNILQSFCFQSATEMDPNETLV